MPSLLELKVYGKVKVKFCTVFGPLGCSINFTSLLNEACAPF
jgi:hypothetical protein